jgi:hypothetical protein
LGKPTLPLDNGTNFRVDISESSYYTEQRIALEKKSLEAEEVWWVKKWDFALENIKYS